MSKHPIGKGVFIWQLANCEGGNLAQLVLKCYQAGFQWVAIKAANGYADYNAAIMVEAVKRFRDAGISVWGWGYVYGGSIYTGASIAAAEADAAIRNINRYKFDGWLIDAESEYKRAGSATWADVYMRGLRAALPDLPIGFCSYRWPTVHPEIPWRVFLAKCDFHAPQVYWIWGVNPGYQLQRSVKELTALKAMPVIPVGASFAEHGWDPTVAQINEFDTTAHTLKLPGLTWWCYDDHGLQDHPAYYEAIKAHVWGVLPEPVLTLDQRVERLEQWVKAHG